MRAEAKILIIISLLFFAGTAAAITGIPDKVTITSNKLYLYPGITGDQSSITVIVENTTTTPVDYSGKIGGATVTFTVNNPVLGTLTPVTKTTDINGIAASIFTANETSGFAVINISVSGYNKLSNVTQKIDHGLAAQATFAFPLEGSVATNVSFNLSFTDYWGNRVDQIINPSEEHTITLHISGPAPDDGGFVGYGHDITPTLDTNGNTSVRVRLSTGSGPNTVTMDQFGDFILYSPKIISGLPTDPVYIGQVVTPDSPPQVPADGNSTFSILYTVYDKFRNPVNLKEVWVNTSVPGEEKNYTSTEQGTIMITYGPRYSTALINITATAVANTSVNISTTVEFTNTAATSMVLTANPETMASRDIVPTLTSDITATVSDILGNEVANETVTFSLGAAVYGGTYTVTSSPSLTPPLSIKTLTDGRATVKFIPGSFTDNKLDPHYSATATGTCTITAKWKNTTETIPVTWKNYPYLSVTTSLNPQIIELNQTVDVTISVRGDGYAMVTKPIDVVITTDTSGSMAGDQITKAKAAAIEFSQNLSALQDKVGLVSFHDTSSIDRSLTPYSSTVESTINGYKAEGNTAMRSAIYNSAYLIKWNGRADATRAIVLLTDGEWNNDGNPLGGSGASSLGDGVGTGSVIDYTKNNNIKLFIIGLGVTSAYNTTLNGYATTTLGKYYNAPTTAELAGIYAQIAGELKTTAGVNATMAVDFGSVNVTSVPMSGANVYDYVYNSTLPSASTKITWQDGVTNVTNQTADWVDQKLDFTIGTIKIDQNWSATFRLKVKKQGIIDLFGTGSGIQFNTGTETLNLPHTFLTVSLPSSSSSGGQTIGLDAPCPVLAQNAVIVPVTWNTNYTGGATDISDEVSYIDESNAQVYFFKGSYHVTGDTITSRSTPFDLRTVKPGSYQIQVRTYTPSNSFTTSMKCGPYTYNSKGVTYIKLQSPHD